MIILLFALFLIITRIILMEYMNTPAARTRVVPFRGITWNEWAFFLNAAWTMLLFIGIILAVRS